MPAADPDAPVGAATQVEVCAAARASVREVVAAGGASGRPGRRWVVPLAAAAAVAAAACAPVAWPLLAGGAITAPALMAAFGQVGAVGAGALTEVVMRAWDRLRAREGPHIGQSELQEALADELAGALVSSSAAAAGLRAEVAGVLQGVDAVKVALTTTIETTAWESADQVRAVLIGGLRELGTQFTEFGWLLEEVNDQITRIAETQAGLAAGSRAMLDAQQQTLMQLMILRQQTRPVRVNGGEPGGQPGPADTSPDEVRAAALDAAGVPVDAQCPYPGLAPFGPQDADRFFGRQHLTAVVVTRLAAQLTRPGLLMVLGPSGSGKSSLVIAAALARLNDDAAERVWTLVGAFVDADGCREPAAASARELINNALAHDRFSPGDLSGLTALIEIFLRSAPPAQEYTALLDDLGAGSDRSSLGLRLVHGRAGLSAWEVVGDAPQTRDLLNRESGKEEAGKASRL